MLLQEFGDGIMSAIDMFATITDVEGKLGEKRLVLTLNGKVRRISACLSCWVLHDQVRACFSNAAATHLSIVFWTGLHCHVCTVIVLKHVRDLNMRYHGVQWLPHIEQRAENNTAKPAK